MTQSYNIIMFIGPPGAGKGTQSKALSAKLGIPHISSGDLIRARRKTDPEYARLIDDYLKRGELIKDEAVIPILRERFAQDDCKNGLILDGTPRDVDQMRAVDALFTEQGKEMTKVIALEVPDEYLMERVVKRQIEAGEGGARIEDNPMAFGARVQAYRTLAEDLQGYFAAKSILHKVDGRPAVEDVTKAVLGLF